MKPFRSKEPAPIPIPVRAPRRPERWFWGEMKLGGPPKIPSPEDFPSAIASARGYARRRRPKGNGPEFAQRTNKDGVREIWRVS